MRIRYRAVFVSLALLVLAHVATLAQGNIQYVYDALGRLIAVIDTNGDTAVYHYDAVGNLLSIDRHASSQVSIVSFSPTSGPIGTTVTIFGTGFSATASQDTVRFNGTTATISTASTTKLVVTVPSSATTGTITVTAPGGSATSAASFTVTTGSLAPTISSFSPTSGPSATAFGIDGTNFDATLANNRATLNATLLSLTSASTAHLNTNVPGPVTSGRITVRTANGAATSSSDFWVAPPGYSASNLESKIRFAGFGDANAVTSTLTSSSNVGLLIFEGTPLQRVSMKVSNSTFTSASATLLSPFGATVTYSGFGTAGVFIDPVTLLPSSATYTLLVKPTSSTGHATLTVYDVGVDPTGTITPGGSSVTTTLSVPGRNGHYTFSGTASHQVSLKVTADSIASAWVSLLNPDGSTLASQVFGTTGGFIDAQTLPTTGTYTVLVDPVGANTGSMTLTLYDATEQTDTIATDGTSKTVTVQTTNPGQNVRLSFTGTSSHRMSVKVGGGPSGTVSILDRDGVTSLGSVSIGAITGLVEPVTLPATGTYAVYVDYTGTNTGSVTLNLYDVGADITGTLNPGGSVSDTLSPPGRNAIYTLGTPVNARVSLLVGAGPIGTVSVRQSNGTTVTSGSMSVTANFIEPWTFASGQTVKVDPTAANTGSYTLTAYDVPNDVTGTVTIGGSAVTVPITQPGQNGTKTFSGTASQHVTVHVTGNAIAQLVVKLLGTDGQTVLATMTSSATSFDLTQVTLPSTGTYTIKVDPPGASTGTPSVRVSSP